MDFIQNVFDELQDFLPDEWKRVALRFEYVPDVTTSMKYYVDSGKGYVECFDLVKDIRALYPVLSSVERILVKVNDALAPKDKWRVLTLIVREDGSFKTYYDYDYTASDPYAYESEWEAKYLI